MSAGYDLDTCLTRRDATPAATLGAAADLSAEGIVDDLAELTCAIGKAMRPTLARLGRICMADPFSGRTDELPGLVGYVDREIDDAKARCIAAKDPGAALEHAIRCAEAAALLGDDEAAEVDALIKQFARQRVALAEAP